MKDQFKKEILKLKNSPFINQKTLQLFLDRLNENSGLTRDENPSSHFCNFFVPINYATKSIYLGNHIKAGGWIPPGGHIDHGELPSECAKRECFEELQYELIDKQIELFNLSIIHLNNPRHNCKTHYDFWYLIRTPKIDFRFDKKEFYEADWFSLKDAYQKILYPEFKVVMKKLLKFYPEI